MCLKAFWKSIFCTDKLTSHGVGSWRKHKHKWDGGVGVQIALTQVKGRRLDKLLPQIGRYIFNHAWHHLIRSKTSNNDHFLQGSELVTPRGRQRNIEGLLTFMNRLKVIWIIDESLSVESTTNKLIIYKKDHKKWVYRKNSYQCIWLNNYNVLLYAL